MKYNDFIQQIKRCQTQYVTALSFPQSCSMHQIPNEFNQLLPELVHIIHQCHQHLCEQEEVAGVFSMQPLSCSILSKWPLHLNRIVNRDVPSSHACYSVDYLPLSTQCHLSPKTWSNARTIVVDFTLGNVMDADQYYFELFHQGTSGKILGKFNRAKLAEVWQTISRKTYQSKRAA